MLKKGANLTELYQRLRNIGWQFKNKIYQPIFESYEELDVVRKPKISVIVISWKWNPLTLQNFQELEKQRKDVRFELIFVNNGAEESEFADLKPYVNKWINLNENTGAYLARNVGVAFADAPILLFLEDDGLPDRHLLKMHIRNHYYFQVHAVRGKVCEITESDKVKPHTYDLGNKRKPFYSKAEGNSSYNAKIFYEIGGWDDNIQFGGGGIDLALRLLDRYEDHRLQIYAPEAVLHHDFYNPDNKKDTKHEKQNKGLSYVRTKHPDIKVKQKIWEQSNSKIQYKNVYRAAIHTLLESTMTNTVRKVLKKITANGG